MKIAIINDQHFGVRNDSSIFLENQKKFYDDIFFPTLLNRDIKTVLDLGDTFDRRKYINFNTLDKAKKMYFDVMSKNNMNLHIINGNHTTYYKNTNELNSLSLLLSEYKNIFIYESEPVELTFGSIKIMMAPWIAKDNYEVSVKAIENTSAQILMGHLEIAGFEMMRGQLCDHGFDKSVFKKFDSVYSGHFHHPSEYENIKYLGAPYEMNWTDFDGKRGFHIFDTETREMEFVKNPFAIFYKLYYDDTDMKVEDLENLDFSMLTNKYIKVIITTKDNPYIFDLFIDKLQDYSPADVKVVEDHMNLEDIGEEELIDEAQDTYTILNQYVDGMETRVDKESIKRTVGDLFQEASNI